MIETFNFTAKSFRETLNRPSPEGYGGKAIKLVSQMFKDYHDEKIRELVEQLSGSKVHPATDRAALMVTVAEHFEHAVNHQMRVSDGVSYENL